MLPAKQRKEFLFMSQIQFGNKPRTNFTMSLVNKLYFRALPRESWKLVRGKGVSVVEILIVVAIIVIALTSFLGLASLSLGASTLIRQTSLATILSQESIEQVRNFRDGTNWNSNGLGVVSAGTAYHLEKSTDNPPKWNLVLEEETIGSFVRRVVFENVMRDGSKNIVTSGGTNDPNTKKITVTVSWQEKKRTHQVELVTYLTNWRK